MKCIKCEQELSNNDSFCSQCGSSQTKEISNNNEQASRTAPNLLINRILLYTATTVIIVFVTVTTWKNTSTHGNATTELAKIAPAKAPAEAPAPAELPAPVPQTESVEDLIKKAIKLDGDCRGNSPSAATDKICQERDTLWSDLKNKGWCHGNEGEQSYQQQWIRCSERKKSSTSAANIQAQTPKQYDGLKTLLIMIATYDNGKSVPIRSMTFPTEQECNIAVEKVNNSGRSHVSAKCYNPNR